MSEEVEAHIYKKFEIVQKLGKGAYGIVWKAIEKSTKRLVALKKVFEAFHNATDAQRTFREVMILQDLNDHPHIVKLFNVIKAENNKDLYLVFEFMETDLHAVIKAGILKKVHKQYIIYQLLKGLKYIHSGEIIHRDLKPSNILINSECLIKVADFGLARSVEKSNEEGDPIMTEYVATRWYRAPEIVLGSNKYSKAVDVWSVGCILAELLNGRALFPGKSTLNQVELILEVLGKPSYQDISEIESENASSIIESITLKNRKPFESFFKDQTPQTLDFLQKCLEFNPAKRITIDEALAHPFVAQFREEKSELVLDHPIKIPIDDNQKLSIKEYREALYNDIIQKKKEQRKLWRQKYLKQLGIEMKGDDAKKDLFRNIMAKRKDKQVDTLVKAPAMSRDTEVVAPPKTKKIETPKKSEKSQDIVMKADNRLRTSSNSIVNRKYGSRDIILSKPERYSSTATSKEKKPVSSNNFLYSSGNGGFGVLSSTSKLNGYQKMTSYYRTAMGTKNIKTLYK